MGCLPLGDSPFSIHTDMKKIFFLAIVISLLGCHKNTIPETQSINIDDRALIIVNEGNYTYANASLTIYNLTDNKPIQEAFKKSNNIPLGDVAQSAYIQDSNLYIIVNNSGKIIRANAGTLKMTGELTGLTAPRYTVFLSSTTAVTSDLYSAYLYLWDTQQMQLIRKIYLGTSSESLALYGDYLFVASWRNDDRVFKVNTNTWQIIDSVRVTYEPNSMVIDKNGKLWVLSDGGLWEGAPRSEYPALTRINITDMSIDTSFVFTDKTLSPSHLCINSSGDSLFFLISAWQQTTNPVFGVYKMAIVDTTLPQRPLIAQESYTFYALNYIPENSWLIITDAADFASQGSVLIYDTQGKFLLNIPAGINPGYAVMKK